MEKVSLGKVCDLFTGGTPSRQKSEYFKNGEIKWLVSGDINQREIFDCEGRITQEGMNNSNAKFLPLNSVLIALNGQGKTRGTVALLRTDATCNQSLVAISPKDEMKYDSKFIFYALDGMYREIRKLTGDSGNDRRGLNMRIIRDIEIPLLQLVEQKLIVTKLDNTFAKIDNLISEISSQIRESHYLIKLIMNSKVEKLPSSSYKKIGEVCSLVRGPFGGSLKKSIFVEEGFAIYEQAHPINNQCKIFRYFITREKFDEMKRFEVKPKDILMSCSGTLGRTTIVPAQAPKGIINQALLKITPSDSLLSEYLQLIMRSDFFQKLILKVSGGAAQQNVPSVKVLKNIAIPIPSIREQKIFIDRQRTLENLKLTKLYEQKRDLLITLKEAILFNEMKS